MDGVVGTSQQLLSSPPIYLISVLTDDGIKYRVWGYYHDRAVAEDCIVNNRSDLCEFYYHYAILSEVGEGPLAVPENQQWYEFRRDAGGTVGEPIAPPDKFMGTIFGF
jgi:hypothetical protein